MAATSAASFLPRLPLMRYSVTNFGATSRTVWPSARNCRAQWCAPEQACHPHHALRQRRQQRGQLVARHRQPDQLGPARLIHSVHREHVLGQIHANRHNRRGHPLPDELMRARTSHRGTPLPVAAARPVRDREVPFMR
jgi:hypothetical protein